MSRRQICIGKVSSVLGIGSLAVAAAGFYGHFSSKEALITATVTPSNPRCRNRREAAARISSLWRST
ncbi:MAG: hypothetical protein ACHQIF_05835 [Steroidobacterales bacterium]|jgi:hypothetical protein